MTLSDLEFAEKDTRIAAHQQEMSVGNSGYEDDDNCTVLKEMIDRETAGNEEYANRVTTEAIAGNLVGYQLL